MVYYTQTSHYGHSTYKECHTGNPLVFTTHDGIEVYAGGSSRSGGWWKMNPLPDFAMGPANEVKKGYSQLKVETKGKNMEGWKCMKVLEERTPPAVLEMDFPDYSVPQDCDVEFWEALALDIREQGVKRMHAMCMGGHGRTGIQLACLRWFLATEEERKAWPDANALISEIRTHYCNKAVEAEKQQQYVAYMCGIPCGEMLGFHKYSGSTTTTTTTYGSKKHSLSASNRDLLECDSCDLIIWEDDKVYELEHDDLCYDHSCTGHMTDITEIAVKRSLCADSELYQICIKTLDVCSNVSGYSFGVLNEELMEKIHGKQWKKILDRLMSQNAKTSVRGKMLRQLHEELKKPTAENVLVCIYDSTTHPEIDNHIEGDYDKKYTRNIRTWKKCGFCASSVSPDRLSVAYLVQNGKELAKMCCPDCMVASGLEFVEKLEPGHFKNEAFFNKKMYKLVAGVSPQSILVAKTLRSENKTQKFSEAEWDDLDDDLDDIVLNFDDKEGTVTQTGGRTLEDYADLSPAEKAEWTADLLDEYGLEALPDDEIERGLIELGLTSAELRQAQAEFLKKKNDVKEVDIILDIDEASIEDYFGDTDSVDSIYDDDNVDPKYGGNNKEEE